MTTETDIDALQDSTEAIANSLDHATLDTKSIESEAEMSGVQYLPQIDPVTQLTQQLLGDGTKYAFDRHRRQRTY